MNQPNMNNPKTPSKETVRDQNVGVPGSHPVGTGLGAVSAGAAAGAVGGAVAGPVGAIAGAAVGAVVGGLTGSAVAEAINPTMETKYWRDAYATRPYAGTGSSYDDYEPAYRYGWESFSRRGDQARTFESVEAELAGGWDQAKGKSRLAWDKARQASRDAWDRVQRAVREPGRRTDG